MTNKKHPPVTTPVASEVPATPAALASQGARRATEEASAAPLPPTPAAAPEPSGAINSRTGDSSESCEVVPRAQRRHFSPADKRRILRAAELCTQPGEIGALMRREGVYSSSLSAWRKQRDAAELAALAAHKRGPKPDAARLDAAHIAQLTRERDHLRSELDKARLVIDVQKKVTSLLDLLAVHNRCVSS